MPTSRTRIPSYRFHSPSGLGMVCLNGRRVYLGKWNTKESKERYRRVVAEWLATGRKEAKNKDRPKLTVVQVIDHYLDHANLYYRKDGRPTKEIASIKDSLKPLFSLYARTPANEFGPLSLKAVRQSMIADKLARNTVNGRIFRIKRMFKWATENELVLPSVYHGLQAVAGLKRGRSEARETEPIKPVADYLVQAIQPHVSQEVWAMIQLQILTGMRPGEVILIRGNDLDTSGKVWVYQPSRHKTEHHGYQRRVYLGPRAQVVIKPFLKPDLAAYLFSPVRAERLRLVERHRRRRTPLSCGNKPGSSKTSNRKRPPKEFYTVDSYRRAIDRGLEKAFPVSKELSKKEAPSWREDHHWHPHQLRHNAATQLRKEFGIEVARAVLGHHSVGITELYAEFDAASAMSAMSKIG